VFVFVYLLASHDLAAGELAVDMPVGWQCVVEPAL
jgi:hypothetical protein